MPTLHDVARRASVSSMTVSRVINGYSHVSPETRKRVQAAIETVGYYPNVPARILASGRSRVVGLVPYEDRLPLFTCPFYQEVVQGIETEAGERGYDLFLFTPIPRRRYGPFVAGSMIVDGAVLMGVRVARADVTALTAARFPFVIIGRRAVFGPEVSYVAPDYVNGAARATEHLLGRGHRLIGLICEHRRFEPTVEIIRGYRAAMHAYGGICHADLIRAVGCGRAGGRAVMHALLSLPTPPTAVLATSLLLALGALDALREQRVRVPEDIAVVGFDDGEAAEHAMLPVTMVRLPKFLMGKAAMAVMVDQLEGIEEAKHIRLPTELIIRASSGG